MCPNRESPAPSSYKVCMIFGNPQVVNRDRIVRILDPIQDNPLTIEAAKLVSGHQLVGGGPASALDPEGVLGGRSDPLTADEQIHHRRVTLEDFLDLPRLWRGIGVVLRRR